MSIWIAVKLFLSEHALEFIKDVIMSFAEDGFKAGIKKLCGKDKDSVQVSLGSIQEKLDHIEKKLKSNNTSIREIAGKLNGLISSLHIKTAHEVLLKLRAEIPISDQYSLSVVDYALGCCSRYVNKDSCLAEFDRAYAEMIGAGRHDADIIGGKLYCLCLEKNTTEALRMSNGLRELDRSHIWAWIPELYFAKDIKTVYNQLPEDIKANPEILANACMLQRQQISLCVDISTYQVEEPEILEYENIPIWLFNLSVLINRYLIEWNADAYAGNMPPGPACKALFDYSSKYLHLAEKTELGDIVPDIDLFNSITQCRLKSDSDVLVKLKDCKASLQFLPIKQISYALFLSKEERFDEAKVYLESERISEHPGVYNVRFYLALVTADAEYARNTLDAIVDKHITMPSNMLVFLMMVIKEFTKVLNGKAEMVKVDGETDFIVYRELCHFFCDGNYDIAYLKEHYDDAALGLKPFVAIALFDAGMTEEAISLSEKCVRDGYVDFCSQIHFELLKKAKAYFKLDIFLRRIREGGYKDNPIWLIEEYALAGKEEDFPRMLEISKILYEMDKNNPSYFVTYITMQYQNGHFDKVTELYGHIGDYSFTYQVISQLFNVLLLSDLVKESVEFLYHNIKTNAPNEQLSMLYHSACMNPKTAQLIRQEYDVVEEGLYVYYEHNGDRRSDIIVKGQRIDVMIGKKKGETVVVKDRMGKDESYKVDAIFNKYYQLLEDIYKDIHENKFQSAISFNIDDLLSSGNGNILEGMAKVAGHDEEWIAAYNTTLKDYKQGNQTFSALFNSDDYITELYNHLFGTFKVYNIPRVDFSTLYKQIGINLDECGYVVDLSALVLLYEIHLKFGINYSTKFIIPQGIKHLINDTIAKEEYAMPSGIYQMVVDKLAVLEDKDDSWFVTRLKGLKSWIEKTFTSEVVHEMVDLEITEDSFFGKSRYLTLEYQCAILAAKGNRVFLSEDIAMTAVFGKSFPVADVNMYIYHFHKAEYVEISHFFIESDIYGGDIELDYVLQQYDRHLADEPSSYLKCQENFSVCDYLYPVVLNFCSRLLSKSILSPADTLTVDSLLNNIFSHYDKNIATAILVSATQQLPHMKRELLNAYRTVYPLF